MISPVASKAHRARRPSRTSGSKISRYCHSGSRRWVRSSLSISDPDAVPLHAYFGPVLDIIGNSGVELDTLELYAREEWRSQANWKAMLENFLECYHCPIAHPGFSAAVDAVLPKNYNLTAHGWFSSHIGQVRPSALEGKSQVKIYDVAGEVAQSQYHLLWPNMTININPGFPNLSIDVWNPDGPNATKGFSEQYFAPGVSEEFARELIAFNKEVGAEDDLLTDPVAARAAGRPARARPVSDQQRASRRPFPKADPQT